MNYDPSELPVALHTSLLVSSEVREISNVLAALEGSASVTPASTLMLAMRFEDQIFKSAKDLADYRKKISKRLKKLQKTTRNRSPKAHNRPQQPPPTTTIRRPRHARNSQ
jgi:hypothetical protein